MKLFMLNLDRLFVEKKEDADNTVTVRKLGSEKQETIKREEFIKNMLKANKLPLN